MRLEALFVLFWAFFGNQVNSSDAFTIFVLF